MRPSFPRRAAVAWLAAVSTACGITVRPHASIPPDIVAPSGGIDPDASSPPRADSPAGGTGVQRVCRANALPGDWVAIDYVPLEQCPNAGGEQYTGALVVRHTAYNRGAELLICADQQVPRQWRRRARVDDPGLELLCRSSTRPAPVSDRIIRIQKQ